MTKVGLKVFTNCRDLAHELPVVAMEASQRDLKNHECRQLLERLQELGWLRLPPVQRLARAVRAGSVETSLAWVCSGSFSSLRRERPALT